MRAFASGISPIPLLSVSGFGLVALIRKLGLDQAGPLFDSAINSTSAMLASTAFVLASGQRGGAEVRWP
jgi:uncharacterized membrane protein